MYTLFGFMGSGSASVECALEIAGQPFELVSAASWEGTSQREQLASVNPLCQIPTLVLEDGSVMSESAAILIHLGLTHPESGLLPDDPIRRAAALRGLVYIPANCYSLVSILDYPERYLASMSDDAKENLLTGVKRLHHKHWDVFADTFSADPVLSAAQPGALDILAAVVTRWFDTREHLASSRPAFADYLQQVDAHERIAPVFSRHW
jgi:GST-like protein